MGFSKKSEGVEQSRPLGFSKMSPYTSVSSEFSLEEERTVKVKVNGHRIDACGSSKLFVRDFQ